MSKGRDRKFDDMSHTRGTPFVSGINGNSTPEIVIVIHHQRLTIVLSENYQHGFIYVKVRAIRKLVIFETHTHSHSVQ